MTEPHSRPSSVLHRSRQLFIRVVLPLAPSSVLQPRRPPPAPSSVLHIRVSSSSPEFRPPTPLPSCTAVSSPTPPSSVRHRRRPSCITVFRPPPPSFVHHRHPSFSTAVDCPPLLPSSILPSSSPFHPLCPSSSMKTSLQTPHRALLSPWRIRIEHFRPSYSATKLLNIACSKI
jgi:hypothetical protein